MGTLSDLCLAPKKEEQSLDQLLKTCSKRKLLKTCSSGSCVPKDHCRYLSDDILSVIVSFLTMNEVAKISLLSRRLLDVVRHTPVLIFLASNSMDRLKFVKWVNHALERHKGQYLKEFKIVYDLDSELKEDINNWLVFALSRKVEHLELNFLSSGIQAIESGVNYYFPDRFLRSDLLKCLKSLSLKNLYVTNEAVSYFLNNCPFLERLELVGIHFFTNLVISCPNLVLKYLRIKDCYDFEVLSISNANLVSLEIPSLGDGLTLTELPMLVELSISGIKRTIFKKSHTLSRVGSCFHSQLEAVTIQGLHSQEVIDLHYLARMTKLKRLVVEVIDMDDESLTMFISIINSCPRLEEFKLMLYWVDRKRTTRNIYHVEGDSLFLQSKSLKVFEFLGYYGRASDVELILHVVKSAVCLEKIIIDPRHQVLLEDPCHSESAEEREARSLAITQLEALRITQCIPPHVDVIIR